MAEKHIININVDKIRKKKLEGRRNTVRREKIEEKMRNLAGKMAEVLIGSNKELRRERRKGSSGGGRRRKAMNIHVLNEEGRR